MFALRAYQAYGNETWLDMVKIVSDNNTRYWDETCGGGVLWLTYRPLIKNTITNGCVFHISLLSLHDEALIRVPSNRLYLGILTRLYRYTGNSTYFDQSVDTLNWWLDWAFDPSNGRVLDTITATSSGSPLSSCTTSGEQTWTYNSGAFLFGITDLYYATGNTRLLDLGRTLAYAAIRDFTDQSTGILTESCENDPPPGEDLPPGCQQDETVVRCSLAFTMSRDMWLIHKRVECEKTVQRDLDVGFSRTLRRETRSEHLQFHQYSTTVECL